MKVTRDVVIDLLPAYFEGEASQDTRFLVEEFFRGNPDFEALARSGHRARHESLPTPPVSTDREMAIIAETKRMIRIRGALLAVSIFMSLVPMTFNFDSDGMRWGWESLPAGAAVAAVLALVAWAAYFRVRSRLGASGV